MSKNFTLIEYCIMLVVAAIFMVMGFQFAANYDKNKPQKVEEVVAKRPVRHIKLDVPDGFTPSSPVMLSGVDYYYVTYVYGTYKNTSATVVSSPGSKDILVYTVGE
jgi:hypothetical protein